MAHYFIQRAFYLGTFNFHLILNTSRSKYFLLELSGSHHSVVKCSKECLVEERELCLLYEVIYNNEICFTTTVLHLIIFHFYFKKFDSDVTSIGFQWKSIIILWRSAKFPSWKAVWHGWKIKTSAQIKAIMQNRVNIPEIHHAEMSAIHQN